MKFTILTMQAFSLVFAPVFALAVTPVTKVVMKGDAATVIGAGVSFNNLGVSNFKVSSDDKITFSATLTGTGITTLNDLGAWMGSLNSFSPMLREGAAFGAGVTFSGIGTPNTIFTGGSVLHVATLSGSGISSSNNQLTQLFTAPSTSTLLVRRGDPVPDVSGATLSAVNQQMTSSNGMFVYAPTMAAASGIDSTNDTGIVLGSVGSPALLLRESSTLNMPVGLTLKNATVQGMSSTGRLNGSGNLVTGGSVDTTNDSFRFFSDGTGVNIFMREGSPAADVEAGVKYGAVTGNIVANGSRIGVQSALAGSASGFANTAVFAGDPADLKVVVRGNNDAPGITPGAGLTQPKVQLLNAPDAMNDLGHIAFRGKVFLDVAAGVTSANDEAAWVGDENGLSLVAREGDLIAGTNLTFANDQLLNVTTMRMNNHDDLAFTAQLAGPGVVAGVNDTGLFYYDHLAGTQLLLRGGDVLDVGGGELHTLVGDLSALSNAYITDNNQLVFGASFTDGKTGIFTLAVPEPSSLCVTLAGAFAFMRRRRKV